MGNRRYQIILGAACILPALLFQTVVPVFPAKAFTAWLEGVGDRLYPVLAAPRAIKAKTPSRVVIVEIDDATLAELGWPIDRAHYARLFSILAEHGRPPVMSLLHFQDGKQDEKLVDAIRSYEVVIGSSLEVENGQELTESEERLLVAKSLLGRKKLKAEDLPFLPLKLRESPKYVRAEKRLGTGARFGAGARVFCVPLYYDAKKPGTLVVPSAMVFAAAEMLAGPVKLGNGVTVNGGRASQAKPTVLEEQHCAPQASVSTNDYLKERKLSTLSFLDVLNGKRLAELKGKLVVLASSEMRKLKGPGELGTADGITTEHRLAARLLDGVISGDTVRRPPLRGETAFAWLPLAAGAALLILGLWAAPGAVVSTTSALFLATVAFSVVQFYLEQKFRVPIQAFLSLGSTLVLFSANAVLERMVAFKQYLQVMRRFRERASLASTLEELEAATQATLKARFPECGVTFEGRSPLLAGKIDLKEEAAKSPRGEVKHEFQEAAPFPCGAYVRHYVYRLSFTSTKRTQTAVMVVDRSAVTLGLAHLSVMTDTWDFWLAGRLLDNVCDELLAHWDRLETAQRQKLSEYRQFVVARELDLGREVQSLLHPPSDEGIFGRWRYRFRYQPFGLMAGDWVQAFIPDPSSKVAILAIGDVVGKGTSAALITSAIAGIWLRHTRLWKVAGAELGKDAMMELIGDLDQTIRELFREKQYSTLALALLSEHQAIVTSIATSPWMSIGVQKPKLVGKSFCDPLGVEKTREGRIVLDEIAPSVGDLLIACTDGVMEGRVPQTRFMAQMDQLKQVYTTMPLDLVEKSLFEAGKESVLSDDKTLIILEYLSETEAKQAAGTGAGLTESA